jgi:hypothetical protein
MIYVAILMHQQLSSGQSCTCVPTEYHDCFTRQKLDFAASVQYMTPDQIKKMLKETLGDYNTFAFEEDEERDEDTRTTAKKAHENAFGVLRTLFNNLPGFKWKPAARRYPHNAHVPTQRTVVQYHGVASYHVDKSIKS